LKHFVYLYYYNLTNTVSIIIKVSDPAGAIIIISKTIEYSSVLVYPEVYPEPQYHQYYRQCFELEERLA